jgi:dipeptidyl aminopeptidase/acylaminoacyl peptidase
LRLALFGMLVTTLVGVVLTLGALWLQVVALTTPVRFRTRGAPADLACEEVTLTTDDGLEIAAWYVPGTQPNAIVLVHGTNANRAYLLPQARMLSQAGYHLILPDLRGHGHSQGNLNTYGYDEALDVRAAVGYLAALPEVEHVGAIGHSLGAAAMVRAASTDERLEALVIQSTYSSLAQAIEDTIGDLTILPKWPFAPLIVALAEARTGLRIGQVDSSRDLATMSPRPVLIIHSDADNLFPLHHAEQMYEAAQSPKDLWVVHGLPHVNAIEGNEAEYKERVIAFFDEVFR